MISAVTLSRVGWPGVRALAGVFLLALVVRLLVAGLTVGLDTPAVWEPASDSRIHLQIVESLLSGKGYSQDGIPVATTPPLYVLFLAGLYGAGATPGVVRGLQALLGAAACLLVYLVGRKMFDGQVALLAALLLAVHPAYSYVAGLHLTENAFLPLLLLALLCAARLSPRPSAREAVVLGAAAGLGSLARAAFLGFLPLLLAWIVLRHGPRWAGAYRTAVLVFLGFAAVLAPWTLRNALVLRAFVPVQSNGALVFWAGNNPHADGGLVWPTSRTWTGPKPPDDGRYGWRDLTVAQENAVYFREALRWIRENPGDYLRLLGKKLARLYGFTRATDGTALDAPVAAQAFQLGLYGFAAAGACLPAARRGPAPLLFLLFAFTNATALVFSGASRYALPMVPSLVLWAALAVREVHRFAFGRA
jgi:4-amino-4-deoxy-L-arabinose transferase-like glycosyltransferase